MLQILVLPVTADFTLVAMDEEEAAEREMRGRRIHASRPTLAADTTWTSSTDTVFDGTYRHLLRAAKAREREKSDGLSGENSKRAPKWTPACCHLSGDDGGGDDGDGARMMRAQTHDHAVMMVMMVVMMAKLHRDLGDLVG